MVDDEPTVWTHNKLDFLKPANIKDRNGRRPDHPEYDRTTLLVPKSYLEQLTPVIHVRLFTNIHFTKTVVHFCISGCSSVVGYKIGKL